MPDDQSGDAFDQALTADPATRHRDAFDEVLAADAATRHQAAPQDAPAASGDTGAAKSPLTLLAGPAPSQAPQQPPSGSSIVSTATSLLGHNATTITPFLRQNGESLDAIHQNWCGAFVNGVLHANGIDGIQGPGKYVATSFMNWGQPVQGEPLPGDVLVLPNGREPGVPGGHVGIATGQIADAPGGRKVYLMQSGNWGGKVAYSWEPAQSVVVRRAPQTSTQAQQ